MHCAAVMGFIFSTLGIVPAFVFPPFLFLTLAGFVLGIVGLIKINKAPELYHCRGLAITGIVNGSILLGAITLYAILQLVFANSEPI